MEQTEQLRRVERVEHMERAMNAVSAAADALEGALAAWDAVQDALAQLTAYYDGGLWQRDFEADEAGLLPKDLKRGVLSEDGLYNLLARAEALRRPTEE